MKTIRVCNFGGPEVLKILHDVPKPSPSANQVLIRVCAAGVNPVDTYIRSGAYKKLPTLPYTPGKDGSGYVEQVGDGVQSFKHGDRVWFFGSLTGSSAEFCVCSEDTVSPLSSCVSMEQGAAIGTPYLTAYRALFQVAKTQPGETVLIHGASGGVGTAAVQLCKAFGVNMIGTAGSDGGMEMLREMGVSHVFNHKTEGYLEQIRAASPEGGPNVILEMLANLNLSRDLQLIGKRGRVAIIGSRGPIEIDPRDIMVSEASVQGVMLFNSTKEELREAMDFITRCIDDNFIQPRLGKTYDLAAASMAHKDIIDNDGSRGKLVLTI